MSRCCWPAGCSTAASPWGLWSTDARPSSSDGRTRLWCIPETKAKERFQRVLLEKARNRSKSFPQNSSEEVNCLDPEALWCDVSKLHSALMFTNLPALWSLHPKRCWRDAKGKKSSSGWSVGDWHLFHSSEHHHFLWSIYPKPRI